MIENVLSLIGYDREEIGGSWDERMKYSGAIKSKISHLKSKNC